jgi:hypothetical protein
MGTWRRFALAAAVLTALPLLADGSLAHADHFSIVYPKGPDPAVGEWPAWSSQVSCGGLDFNPVAAFGGPTEAESGTGGAELALQRYLAEISAYTTVSKRYWRLLAATETRTEFAEGRLEQGPLWLSFELSNGQWTHVGMPSYCVPRTVREGRVATRWTLTRGQALGRKTKRILVDLSGGGCNGGASLNAMAEKPEFRQFGKRLVMTIWLKPLPPGVYTCQALVEPPLAVKLPGRLGGRRLFDGATYPPRLRQ